MIPTYYLSKRGIVKKTINGFAISIVVVTLIQVCTLCMVIMNNMCLRVHLVPHAANLYIYTCA